MTIPDPSTFAWLDTLVAPAWAADPGGRLIFANAALLSYSGLPPERLEADVAQLLHPEDRGTALASWKGFQQEGAGGGHQLRLVQQGGRARWFCVQVQPAPGGSWVALAHDIHDLKLVDERAARVQELTATLAGARDVPGVLGALPLCARVLDAPRASVTVLRAGGREMHLVGALGYPEESLGAFRVLPTELSVPAADVLRSGEPLILSGADFAATYPHLTGRQDTPSGTLAALPLIADGRPVGVLTLGFVEARAVGPADLRFMLTLAEILAQALERARLYEEERAGRQQARAVLDAAPQLMWTTRPGEAHVQFNRTWAEYTGLAEVLERRAWEQVIHPGDLKMVQAARADGIASGQAYTREVRFRRHDGTYRWHEVNLRPLGDGEWLGSATDIHDRKEAERARAGSEAALREERDRATSYLRVAAVMLLVLDGEGRIETINRRGAELLGYADEADLIGRDWFELAVPPPARDQVRGVFAAFMSGALEAPEAYENPVLHVDGTQRLFAWRNTLLRGPGGRIIGTLSSGEDITERRAAEARGSYLLALEERLRAAPGSRAAVTSACELLGQELDGVLVAFCEVQADGQHTLVESEWRAGNTPSATGTHRLADYGPERVADLLSGQPVRVEDVTTDPRTAGTGAEAAYAALGARASLDVPLLRDGRVRALLSVGAAGPRRWSGAEVALARETLERTWQAAEQARAEAALQASQAQLSAVLDALPVGVLIADAAGRLLRDNAAHRELWGVSPETTGWEGYGEWVGWWPETGERIRADEWAMGRALLQGETVRGELVEYQPFGRPERRFFLNNAAPIRDAVGRVVGGVVAEQDVTAQVAAERGLRQNAERVQLALSAGAILGTWFWDLPTDRFTVDEGFAVNFGLDPALGREGLSLEQVIATVHPDDRAGLITAINEVVARGGAYAHQYRVRRRDGRFYWIEANGRVDLDEDGAPQSFPGVLLDVEERRAMVGALRESEARFRELADHISQFAWTTDASGAITWYNQRWYDYTGTTFEAMRGWGWTAVHHPDHVNRVAEKFRRAVEAGEGWEDTFPLRGRDGTYRWFLSRALPIRDDAGQVLRWFGTNTDVTEQLAAETQLREVNVTLERRVQNRTAELRAANEELGAFAYTVSHDLRSPVRHVASFASLLRKKVGDDPGVLRYVDQIESAATRMETLTDALLGLARTGAAQLQKTDVDLNLLVAAARSDLTPELVGRNVTWRIGTLPVVRADVGLLRQVLTNLLSNAVKYSGGRAQAVVEVWAEQAPQEVVVVVRDNGAGFDPAYASKLFGVFQRLHLQSEFEGTGVGLANVRRIVEKHGGRVWAQGRPGEGARFSFSLPSS